MNSSSRSVLGNTQTQSSSEQPNKQATRIFMLGHMPKNNNKSWPPLKWLILFDNFMC